MWSECGCVYTLGAVCKWWVTLLTHEGHVLTNSLVYAGESAADQDLPLYQDHAGPFADQLSWQARGNPN